MIQHIKIENYKSILSLEIDLGRVNVLIGENGCGKTNILEAIALGSLVIDDTMVGDGFLPWKGIRLTDADLMFSGFGKAKKEMNITFSNETDTYPLDIIHVFDPDQYWFLKNTNYTNTDKERDTILAESKEDFLIALEKGRNFYVNKVNKTNIPRYQLYAPENTYLRRFDEEGQIRPLGIRGEALFSHFADLVRKEPEVFKKINETLQLIDWFEGSEIPNDLLFNERRIQIKDRYLEDGIAYIDQRCSNEGFLYLLFYITLFVSPHTSKFFAIDNIDNALNHRLCAKLIGELVRLAKENDKQVIVTAHSPGLLDGLNLNDQEQRLFVISRNKLGHTKALRIEQKPSANGHESVKLSEQFLRGYIGGLPNI